MRRILYVFFVVVFAFAILCSCGSKEIESISISNNNVNLEVGASTNLTVSYTPAGISDSGLSWSSSDESVVSVNNGNVKALKKGNAEIIVMASNGIKASCNITVKDTEIKSIKLDKTRIELFKGKSQTIKATVLPENATQKIVWSSSDTSVAYVDNSGKVIGLKKGDAIVSCETEDNVSATCIVKVKEKKKKAVSYHSSTKQSTNYVLSQNDINVENEVKNIRDLYYTTQDNPGTKTTYNGVEYYSKSGQITKIVAPKGTNGWIYRREYYFNNGSLYFAFINKGKEEHRMYYFEGVLIRYIDNNKNTTDYPNEIYCPFNEQCVSESSGLLYNY